MAEVIRDIEPWFADGLEIRKSIVHGHGLYTKRYFARGGDILRLGGCLFHISERRLPHIVPSTTTPLSEQVLLAEPSEGCKDYSDLMNHSCEPNIGFRDALAIVAIRNIHEDEELLIDYMFWEGDSAWTLKSVCNCGSQYCRKNVTGEDWKAIRPADELFPYFSPFLRRRILIFAERGTTT